MSLPFNLDNFNALVSQASDTLTCNSECQQQRQANNLKQAYEDSQANLASAASQEEVAEKNYVLFTQGQTAYDNLLNNKLQSKSSDLTREFTQTFNNEVIQTRSQIDSYSGILINFRNIVDLYIQYKEDNKELFNELKHKTNDVLTNERKTYYEDQNINNLKLVYFYILLVVYIICAICFMIFYFIYPSNVSWKIMLSLVIGFILLPFISSWILSGIIYLLYKVYGILPKNVYAEKDY
jgi:hypothetical protein